MSKNGFSSFMIGAVTVVTLTGSPTRADGPTETHYQIASGLYRRLTSGEFLLTSNPLYSGVLSKVIAKDYMGAADIITHPETGADTFYNNTVADLLQTVNVDSTAVGDRNDITAMMLCAVKHDMTPFQLLTDDFICYDPTETTAGVGYAIDDSQCDPNNPDLSGKDCNSGHYRAVWRVANPRLALKKAPRPGSKGTGIFTSWTWASNFDMAGTGRRNLKAKAEHLFLSTLEALRTEGLPTDYIRKDIPFDEPNFVTDCALCHTSMDAEVGAHLDKKIVGKSFIRIFNDRINVQEEHGGRNVTDTSFRFFFSQQQNQIYGINEAKHSVQTFAPGIKYIDGIGLDEWATIIANSRGLHEGFVKRIVAQMYMNRLFSIANLSQLEWDTINSQSDTIQSFTNVFVQEQNFRKLWGRIAVWYTVGAQ